MYVTLINRQFLTSIRSSKLVNQQPDEYHSKHGSDNDNAYEAKIQYIPSQARESPEQTSPSSHSAPPTSQVASPSSFVVKRASKGVSLRYIITGIALVLFLLLSSIVGISIARTMTLSQQQTMATATADMTLLRAKSQATTGAATSVAQTTATAYATQNPYPLFTKPFLDDPLTSNSDQAEWYVGDTGEDHGQADGTCSFTPGGYDLKQRYVTGPDGDAYFGVCSSQKISLIDFVFQVQMKVIKGNCGGMAFRYDEKPDFYYVNICQDGSYSITRFKHDGPPHQQNLDLAAGSSSAIKKGLMQLNQIAIAVHGHTFDLYVNHKQIASAQNKDYIQGLIGLVVMAQPSTTTEVLYNNAQIWVPSLQ
jgi:hypothetical protein